MFSLDRITVQLVGVIACFAWVFVCALVLYLLIAGTVGLRASSQHEQRGPDLTEHAEIGYPEFPVATAYDPDTATRMEARA